ncbi:SAF domain-containing protein [Rothia sp. HC945]|uniref:SAF domain-containing protein n=1 Tax=Rothia sp. HC945 TaxID=3171170 RepID=UPI003F1E584C
MLLFRLRPPFRRRVRPTVPLGVRIRSHLSRRARLLGTVLLIAATFGSWFLPSHPSSPEAQILIAKRRLDPGHHLSSDDIEVVAVRGEGADSLRESTPPLESVVGARLAIAVDRGHQVTGSMTAASDLTRDLPQGTVAVALPVRDAASLRHLGRLAPVDLFAHGDDHERLRAQGFLIMPPESTTDSGPGFSNQAPDSIPGGNLAFFAVQPDVAEELAGVHEEIVVAATTPVNPEAASR